MLNNPIRYTDPSGKTPFEPPDHSASFRACVSSLELRGVDLYMKSDVCRMIPELESAGFYKDTPDEEHITSGYRDARLAHKLSTAYHIIHDLISIEDLK